jgi:hypothetical protein
LIRKDKEKSITAADIGEERPAIAGKRKCDLGAENTRLPEREGTISARDAGGIGGGWQLGPIRAGRESGQSST